MLNFSAVLLNATDTGPGETIRASIGGADHIPTASQDAKLMSTCWAHSLGDCGDKMTNEHVISKGMFPGPLVEVKGLPWCENEFREVGVAGFVRKVLCDHHNNTLSPVDEAGVEALNAFRSEISLNNARTMMKPRKWTVQTFNIDGWGLERWCLKTLITTAVDGEYRIGADSETIGQPSSRLVRIAFGKERFRPRAGLYGLGRPGMNFKIREGYRLIPLANLNDMTLRGALFGIHGYQFMLALEEAGVDKEIMIPDFEGGPDYATKSFYPLLTINFQLGKHISHRFKFKY